MSGHGKERVVNKGRVPRAAPRRDAILRLLDGRHTARQIGDTLGITDNNVRAVVKNLGLTDHLRPATGAPIAAPFPVDVVLRDLGLPAEVARWLLDQTKDGASLQDVIRGAIVDAFQEETGL